MKYHEYLDTWRRLGWWKLSALMECREELVWKLSALVEYHEVLVEVDNTHGVP